MDTCERCGLERAVSIGDLSRYDEKCFRHIPTKANEDGCRWAIEKRRKLLTEPLVFDAVADARAAGYAEAKEQAENVARGYAYGQGSGTAIDIAEDIAALAPATTKEPT